MNQPAQALTFDQLEVLERATFDAFGAIGMALAHNLILGITIQARRDEENNVVLPGIGMIFHGEGPDAEPQQMLLSVPEHGTTLHQLLMQASVICTSALNEYQAKTSRAAEYYAHRQEIEKVRKAGRSRILVPGGRN